MRQLRYCVSHTLTRRYVLRAIFRLNSLFPSEICFGFSAIQHWLSKSLALSAFCANQVLWIASFSFWVGALLVYLVQIVSSFSIFETDLFAEALLWKFVFTKSFVSVERALSLPWKLQCFLWLTCLNYRFLNEFLSFVRRSFLSFGLCFLVILATKRVAHNKALKRDCKRVAVLV